jgi:hypothetical protein
MTSVDWLMMWHSCMSRGVLLAGHTNISIDDKVTVKKKFASHARSSQYCHITTVQKVK